MSAQYLLPCRCGRSIVVEPRRAGETALCPTCGASVLIPTMREMAALEPAPTGAVPSPSGTGWQWRHRTLLLGVVLAVAAIVLAVIFYAKRPIAEIDTIDPDHIRQTAKELTPLRTWRIWEMMKQGLDRRTDQKYADRKAIYRIQQSFAGVLGLAGVGLIVAGAAMGRKKRGEGRG